MWDSKPATCFSQGTHNSFLKKGECPVRKQNNLNMKLLNRASDWKFSADLKTSLQFPKAHERKKKRYETLRADCMEKGFLGYSIISSLSKKGISGRSLKVASNRLQTTAQYAPSWIWSKVRCFQHEWNARGTTISVWLRDIKKRLL